MVDISSLGIKAGLEIHQQLDTAKLFCSCPSLLRDDLPHFTIMRKMRAVAGESGDVDVAASVEQQKEQLFTYEGYNDTTCLVECDEEPPHGLNQDALVIALQTAKLVHATIIPEIQVMRKTIANGSVVSGFQRTGLIALNGHIDGDFGTIRIETIMLEEDAAKEIAQEKDNASYRLDRLGIPLIEIATGPDITAPQQCMDVAAYIGMVLRSTDKVKRGIGTIRQDVNVSIAGGQRIEIKGAQELKLLPILVEYEALRQHNFLELAKMFKTIILGEPMSITPLFEKTTSKIIAESLAQKGVVLGVRVGKMAGLIGKEVQPGKRLGTELSDYAKVHGGVGGIFHSDELPKYGITQEEVLTVRKQLACKEEDAFVLVAAPQERAARAIAAVVSRLRHMPLGIPKEVRRANPDGTTSYMRPMPGAARLYPETDVRSIRTSLFTNIILPELWTEKVKRIETIGLSKDLAHAIVSDGHGKFFLDCVVKYPKVKPGFMAETIISMPKTLQRKYNIAYHPTAADFSAVFEALSQEKITKDAVLSIFQAGPPLQEKIPAFAILSDVALEKEIRKIAGEMKGVPHHVMMGKIIDALKTRADAQKIILLVKKIQKV